MSHYEVVENKVAVDRVVISTGLENSRGSLYFPIRNVRNKFFKFSNPIT